MEGDEAEREKIYELFEKAVKDYICKRGPVSIKWTVIWLACSGSSLESSFSFYGFIFTPIWQLKKTAGTLDITDLLNPLFEDLWYYTSLYILSL